MNRRTIVVLTGISALAIFSGATVFHLEHGLDPLVAWFDALTGQADGPRSFEERNKRGDYATPTGRKAEPTPVSDDLEAEADKAAAELEAAYDRERLVALVKAGGRDNG